MSPRWRKVLRDLSSHRFRTMLVVLSIAIGIFAVGVVMGTREVLVREFDVDYASSASANVTYRTQDFDEELVASAADEPEVSAVQARRSVMLRYTWRGAAEVRTLSIETFADFDAIRVNKVVPAGDGHWPPEVGEIVLEAAAKQVGDYAIGDTLGVERVDGETVSLRVAGFAHDINAVPAQFVGYETGYVAYETLAYLGEPEAYNQLSLLFADEEITWPEASRLATDLRERLFGPDGPVVLHIDVPEPGSHFLGDIFKAVSLLLLALGVLALGLSAFLVVNTVSALMAQQVRQVGIMKAVGGSAGQLEGLYIVTVLIYGLLAVAIGLPAAAAGSRWFTDFAAEILNFSVTSYALPGWVVAVEVAVGLLVPLLAAVAPVRRGTRMSVVRALNATGMTEAGFGHGLTDRVLGAIRGLPRPVALSLRNTFLRKGRLALTLSTLTLASAVVMAVFSVQASIERTISDLESWWRYDVQIAFATPQDAEALEAEVAGLPNVAATESWPAYSAALVRSDDTRNESFGIVGLDPETDFVGPTLVEGRWLEVGDTDAVVINTDAQNEEPSLAVGSEVTLDVFGAKETWRVVGVIKGQLGGPTIFCDDERLADAVGMAGVTRLLVRGASSGVESEQELLTAVEDRLADAGYQVTHARTRSGLAEQLREQLGILVAFLVIMAALLASVGVIGLTGTMTINVLESTREIGVMRATGAQHRSIYQIFVTEGVTVGTIAWAAGAMLAYPLSLGLVRLLAGAIGLPLSYAFSWVGVAAWLALMLVISGLASVAPAFRASQVSVRDAIAYE
jgi:putative ABC transport system permease protein